LLVRSINKKTGRKNKGKKGSKEYCFRYRLGPPGLGPRRKRKKENPGPKKPPPPHPPPKKGVVLLGVGNPPPPPPPLLLVMCPRGKGRAGGSRRSSMVRPHRGGKGEMNRGVAPWWHVVFFWEKRERGGYSKLKSRVSKAEGERRKRLT